MEPRWYLKTQYNPVETDPEPFASELLVKYQMVHVAAIMNCVDPMMKFMIQRYPNKEYKRTYLVLSLHFTVVKKGISSLGPISPTEPICRAMRIHTKNQVMRSTMAIGGTMNI